MLYIYGGKSSIFQMVPFKNENQESDLCYSGESFPALQETILVTFNYRRDLFATLYLEDELSANLQLFDQHLAIQWVKKYISELCGDAERLTLFGNSAGGGAVGYQLISTYSKNLIHNAILQSLVPFPRKSLPVTKDELAINSFLAIIELGACMNFTDLKVGGLSEKVKANFFDRQAVGYFLNKNSLLRELKELTKNDGRLEEGCCVELLELVRFLSKSVDAACLQRLPSSQIINVSSAYTATKWSIYFDDDFISADAYQDYKLYKKLNLNPNVNLLIGNLVGESYSETFWLPGQYYTDQFNAPVIEKTEMIEILKEKIDFLVSG